MSVEPAKIFVDMIYEYYFRYTLIFILPRPFTSKVYESCAQNTLPSCIVAQRKRYLKRDVMQDRTIQFPSKGTKFYGVVRFNRPMSDLELHYVMLNNHRSGIINSILEII